MICALGDFQAQIRSPDLTLTAPVYRTRKSDFAVGFMCKAPVNPCPESDLPRVPEHWRSFGTRASPLTGSPRRAVNAANSALNYLIVFWNLRLDWRLLHWGWTLDWVSYTSTLRPATVSRATLWSQFALP